MCLQWSTARGFPAVVLPSTDFKMTQGVATAMAQPPLGKKRLVPPKLPIRPGRFRARAPRRQPTCGQVLACPVCGEIFVVNIAFLDMQASRRPILAFLIPCFLTANALPPTVLPYGAYTIVSAPSQNFTAPAGGCIVTAALQGGGGGNALTAIGGAAANFSVSFWLPDGVLLTASVGTGGTGSALGTGTTSPSSSAGGGGLAALAFVNYPVDGGLRLVAVAGGGGGASVPSPAGSGGSAGAVGLSGFAGVGGASGRGGNQTAGGGTAAVYSGTTAQKPGSYLTGGVGGRGPTLTYTYAGGSSPGLISASGGAGYYTTSYCNGGGGGAGYYGGGGGSAGNCLSQAGGGGGSSFVDLQLVLSYSSTNFIAQSSVSGSSGTNGSITLLSCIPPTPSPTPTQSPSQARTPSQSISPGASQSQVSTGTVTPSASTTQTPSRSGSQGPTVSQSQTLSLTPSISLSQTASASVPQGLVALPTGSGLGIASAAAQNFTAPSSGCFVTAVLEGGGGGNALTSVGGASANFSVSFWLP
jgi:hypothetical protein